MSSIEEQTLTTPQRLGPSCLQQLWFFYWRSSPHLWKQQLLDLRSPIVLIPIHWAAHCRLQAQEQSAHQLLATRTQTHLPSYYFQRENDLAHLAQLADSLGIQLIFFLPLSPMPFLAAGGLPAHLAKTPLCNQQGTEMVCFEQQGQMIHLYSFFDRQVYQEYCRFLSELKLHLQQQDLKVDLYGLESVYRDSSMREVSTLQDYSECFWHHYRKQLKKHPQLTTDQAQEQLRELYLQTAKELLADDWKGSFKGICPLIDSHQVITQGFKQSVDQHRIFDDLFYAVQNQCVFIPLNLNSKNQNHACQKAMWQQAGISYLQEIFDESCFEKQEKSYVPLHLIQFFAEKNCPHVLQWAQQIGIYSFLENQKSGGWGSSQSIDWDQLQTGQAPLYFCQGRTLDDKMYQKLMKAFLNGAKIIVDWSQIDERYSKKWHWFLVENNLKTTQLSYHLDLEILQMGEGRVILFNSQDLAKEKISEQNLQQFWQRIFHYNETYQLKLETEQGLEFFWLTRASSVDELSFMEMRRLYLYNPTHYQLKASLKLQKQFALVKVLDQTQAKVQSQVGGGIHLDLAPGASLALDLGRYHQ